MTLGIIDRPERARRTLKAYGVSLHKARLTMGHMFRDDDDDELGGVNSGSSNGNGGGNNMLRNIRNY